MGKSLTTEDFITKAKIKHGDKYDYSAAVYTSNKGLIKIICRTHGLFEQTYNNHTQGKGCNKCGRERTTFLLTKTNEDFIAEASKVHNNKYDYSLTKYTGAYKDVQIICPIHGTFNQKGVEHTQGSGCMKCGKLTINEAIGKLTINEAIDKSSLYIKKFRKVHGNTYNYDKVEYIKATSKITVNCSIHGDFKVTPNKHLTGNGCAECGRLRTAIAMRENSTGWSLTNWVNGAKKSSEFNCFKVYFVILKSEEEQFYKLGRTYCLINSRLRHIPYTYEVIHTVSHDDPKIIFDLENHLKRTFKGHKYKPLKPFGGQHECFKFDDPTIQSVLREMQSTSCSSIIPTSTK